MPSPLSGGNASGQIKGICVMTHTNQRGAWAEDRVATLLHTRGWLLIERNWCCRWGELDLVLHKNGQLLVVEVKGRSSRDRDRGGLDAFGACKRRKLACAISCWRADHPEHAHQMLQVVLALVPIGRPMVPIRWLPVDHLG